MSKILSEREIGANLRKVVDASGLGVDGFAAAIGIKPSALSNFLNGSGGRKPSNLITEIIAQGINGNWYLTGEGRMFAHEMKASADDEIENAELLKTEAQKIQLFFDRGWVRCNCKSEGTFSGYDSSTRAERSGAERRRRGDE
ncbi:MAG: hypothetical protein HGB02_03890 [Chlorobiaceae bacterium]|nr:hypothetical protein [Chlorobiaceae bacterium]